MDKRTKLGIGIFALLNLMVGLVYSFVVAFFVFDNKMFFMGGCVIYLILSIGLFKLQAWARLILLLTIIPLTFVVCFNIINFYIVYPGLPNYHALVTRIMVKNSLYTLPFIIFCEAFLYFFTRQEVKQYYAGGETAI